MHKYVIYEVMNPLNWINYFIYNILIKLIKMKDVTQVTFQTCRLMDGVCDGAMEERNLNIDKQLSFWSA